MNAYTREIEAAISRAIAAEKREEAFAHRDAAVAMAIEREELRKEVDAMRTTINTLTKHLHWTNQSRNSHAINFRKADLARIEAERERDNIRSVLKALEARCSQTFMAHSLVATPDKELIAAREILAATEQKP